MAVKKEATISRYIGLAADTKPTSVPVGSTFLEYDTGQIHVTYDGTNWVVKETQPLFSVATGSTTIAKTLAPAVKFRLLRVEMHLGGAPTQETFTIKLDAGDGAAYDVVLYSRDMSVGAPEDLVIPFGEGYEFEADDEIDLAWANTDGETYGVRIAYELV